MSGRLWGSIVAASRETLPADTEVALRRFTDLLATAIANTAARGRIERLAAEHAALRRVATLVAEGASATAVFDCVASEIGALLDADGAAVCRYEPDGEITVVARWGAAEATAASAAASSPRCRAAPIPAPSSATPIVVEGRLWGLMIAAWQQEQSPPPDTEQRVTEFAQLLGTAIANADSRDQLIASRARIVASGDEARRRVVRDLHDGAQQRLLHTVITLKLAKRALDDGDSKADALVDDAVEHAERGYKELRELAHGMMPPALTRGGLHAGIGFIIDRLDLPVAVDVPRDRLPAEIESSAYFVVAEALTNVVKHAQATSAEVRAAVDESTLRIDVHDDGVGGPTPAATGCSA